MKKSSVASFLSLYFIVKNQKFPGKLNDDFVKLENGQLKIKFVNKLSSDALLEENESLVDSSGDTI